MYFEKYNNKLEYNRENRKEYYEETKRLTELFKQDCFDELGIRDNPKRERAFSLAWEHGHSGGYQEVYNYLLDFVELIK